MSVEVITKQDISFLLTSIAKAEKAKQAYEAMSSDLEDMALDSMTLAKDIFIRAAMTMPKDKMPNARIDEMLTDITHSIGHRQSTNNALHRPTKAYYNKHSKVKRLEEIYSNNNNAIKGLTRKQLLELFNLTSWNSIQDTVEEAEHRGFLVKEMAMFHDGRGRQPFVYKKA